MRDLGFFNMLYRVLLIASSILLIPGPARALNLSVQMPSSGTPMTMYDIPQSQALTITLEAIRTAKGHCGAEDVTLSEGRSPGKIRVYAASYSQMLPLGRGFAGKGLGYAIVIVIPTAGIAGSGQRIDGFRFEILYPAARRVGDDKGGCGKALESTLQTALDVTGRATPVTSLAMHPD